MNNREINMNNLRMLEWVNDIVGKEVAGGAYHFVCDNVRNNKTCKCKNGKNGLCEHLFAKTERNIEVLMAHDDLHWKGVSCNPYAIELLKQNPENIVWEFIGDNPNPDIVNIIKEYAPEDIWLLFVSNPNLNEIWEDIFEYYLLYCDEDEAEHFWEQLSLNSSSKAITIIESNLDKINWCSLSSNPSALHILEQNKSKINANQLTKNPAIYVYNYDKMSKKMRQSEFFKKLMQNRFHPKNYEKFEDWGFDA